MTLRDLAKMRLTLEDFIKHLELRGIKLIAIDPQGFEDLNITATDPAKEIRHFMDTAIKKEFNITAKDTNNGLL